MNAKWLKTNKQSDLTQSRQDRHLLRYLWRQSFDTRSFQNWRQHALTATEEQAAEDKERQRHLYGPWTPAETRAWENQEEAAALRDHTERVRDGFRLEEETTITIRNLEAVRRPLGW